MNNLILAILLTLITTSISYPARPIPQTRSLRLTTEITEQRYCDSEYADMALNSMSLRLTFTNADTSPIILYKGSNLAHYVLVSLNKENAANKKYELNQHVGWITSGKPKLAKGTTPGAEFIVLAPGASYKTKTDISFPVALEPGNSFLKPGNYVLQIVVETWPGNADQFDRLQIRWRNTGFLCSPHVKSEPMPFEVEKEPRLVQCN